MTHQNDNDRGDPRPPHKNVPLPPGFGARLEALREARHLAKADLAEQAGLTWRTVHNLETEARDRAQQKTLLAVADALGIPYAELINGQDAEDAAPPAPARGRNRLILAVLAGVVVVAAGFAAVHAARSAAVVEREGLAVVARDPVLGTELWSLPLDKPQGTIRIAPWDRSVVLLNAPLDEERTLPLQARDRATGELLWWVEPDIDQLVRALGEEMVLGYPMGCFAFETGDVDGDGQAEIAAMFRHTRYHPAAMCLISREGKLVRQYANKGHLHGIAVADIDGDGKDEVLATGTNNTPAYGGPSVILLDDAHWAGASIDSLGNPWSTEPDSCLVRVVFKALPPDYRKVTGSPRTHGQFFQLLGNDGEGMRIAVQTLAGSGNAEISIVLDAELNPLSATISDVFLQLLVAAGADSLLGMGPADEGWRREWLMGARRFGAGVLQNR